MLLYTPSAKNWLFDTTDPPFPRFISVEERLLNSMTRKWKSFFALQRHCSFDPDAEITFEANPDDITPEKVHHLQQLGVNRISLGVQSFDEQRLLFLKRRHTAQQAFEAIAILQDAGIKNISIDLIFWPTGTATF